MEGFFWATIGAIVGALVGGLVTWWTTNSRLRRELELLYDRDLRDKRVDAYRELWKRTKGVPRRRMAGEVTGGAILKVREDWHEWYYDEGGIYMSEAVRSRYFDATQALEKAADLAGDRELLPAEYDDVYAKVSALRDALTGDIGARLEPQLSKISGTRK
jgi:hypothetical protein